MHSTTSSYKSIKLITFLCICSIILNSCNGKLPGGDARKFPADPKKRVEKNLSEGRGFTINSALEKSRGGVFEFASSNELWRASLDTIDFMPLSSVNYSGGVIISDWYSDDQNSNESIKLSIRFLTNEIRSDAIVIKVFNRKCGDNLINCSISENQGALALELKKEILKKATIYQKQKKEKNFKPYVYSTPD